MKICLECGEMISPYPIHKTEHGTCDNCSREWEKELGLPEGTFGNNPIENSPPKIKGRHMIVKKSQAQILMEQKKRQLGKRYY